MSESKTFLVIILKWRISGQGYKHLTRFSRFVQFKTAASTMQKVNPVGCFKGAVGSADLKISKSALHFAGKCCENHLSLSLNRFVQSHPLTAAINN